MITTQALTKRYANSVLALADLTVSVEPGIVGLVGANGAGKSTLIKILLGLLPPTSGTVSVLGLDPTRQAAQVRARVGYMPEHDCLPPDLAAAEFVTHMARISGLPKTAARERASETLRHVGLYEERYRQIGGYSTGMKQRVKLAQALVHDPDVLLLDEPTNGLDPAGRDAMLTLIHRIGTEFGISVVVCSHLLGEVERICDSLVAIDAGKLLRADRISAMTTARDVLVVEVAEGVEDLVERLNALGLDAVRDGRMVQVVLADDETYDTILGAVAELDLPLHSLDQRRHRVAELFAREAVHVGWSPGVIHDIGYQRYEGPRLGRSYSVRSLYSHGLRTAFGLGRSGKAKVFPWICVGIVMLVATVLTVIRSQSGEAPLAYWMFPQAIVLLMILFAAVVAPELVSRDLRGGVLPLYFSRPLTRIDYALAKLAALASALFLLLLGPLTLMFIGAAFSVESMSKVWPELGDYGKGVAISAVYAVTFAALGLLVASLAGRRAVAAAMIVALFLITTPVYGVLMGIAYGSSETGELTGGALAMSQLAGLVSPMTLVLGVGQWWFDTDAALGSYGPLYGLVTLALVLICAGLLLLRYRRVAR